MQAQRKHYQGFKDQRDKLQDKHYRAFFRTELQQFPGEASFQRVEFISTDKSLVGQIQTHLILDGSSPNSVPYLYRDWTLERKAQE